MKHLVVVVRAIAAESPLTEGRGLKRIVSAGADLRTVVAPHGGAWIETILNTKKSLCRMVAPHGGAWIETLSIYL